MNPYISDILAQPSALRELLKNYPIEALKPLTTDLQRSKFDRVLVTGMGSSFNAAYPAVMQLSRQPIPVQFVNAGELVHFMDGFITDRTLLWMNSQSGRSAELIHLLDLIKTRPPISILTFVNDGASPMASAVDTCLEIHAGPEATVSTKTYINMLAANLLAAVQLTGGDVQTALSDCSSAAGALENHLSGWQALLDELDTSLAGFDQLFILGRGSSMSAVWNGSLINKEAAKSAFEGMNCADFRHGPLELVSPGFTALIFAGSPLTSGLNRALGLEIVSHGGRALWIDSTPDPDLPTWLLPKTSDLARPLAEIIPLQLLTLVMARRKNLQAGRFRYVGKVTDRE